MAKRNNQVAKIEVSGMTLRRFAKWLHEKTGEYVAYDRVRRWAFDKKITVLRVQDSRSIWISDSECDRVLANIRSQLPVWHGNPNFKRKRTRIDGRSVRIARK